MDTNGEDRPKGRQGAFEGRAEARAGMDLRVLPIAEIRVTHNPRATTDVEGVRELAASIARVGQIEPVAVAEDNGGYVLIAGGRRLEALKELGREEVTCVVLDEDGPYLRRARSIAENTSHKAMDPGSEARAIGELMGELGLEVEDVAEVLGISTRTARARLELLKLPAEVRSHVRAGRITLRGAAHLAEVAERSDGLARELGERVACGAVERRTFDADPAATVADIAADGPGDGPFCLAFSEGTRLKVAEVAARIRAAGGDATLKGKRTREAAEEAQRKFEWTLLASDTTLLAVTSEDVVRARAWGGLLEYRRDPYTTTAYLTCAEFACDWLLGALGRTLDVSAEGSSEGTEPQDEDAEKARAERRREREEARATNEKIGWRCRVHLDHQSEVSLEQATTIAGLLIDAYGRELAQGLRLTRNEWRQREVREMASGVTGTVERPPEPDEARELFEELLAKAESGPQLIGRLFSAVVSAVGADQRALQPSARREVSLPYAPGRKDTAVGRLAAALLAEAAKLVPEGRYRELRDELGADEVEELRDRRSARQIEREQRERELREAERRQTEDALDELLAGKLGRDGEGTADLLGERLGRVTGETQAGEDGEASGEQTQGAIADESETEGGAR